MPLPTKYPYTPKRGQFKGRTFYSAEEYAQARNISAPTSEVEPSSSRKAPPSLQYTKGMVEAVVKMIEGGLAFTPLFRGENGITPEEHDWLVNDWFDFGKRHPFFARLITQMFAVDLYGKLAMDHVVIFGSRMIATGRLPEQARFPIFAAYMARQAMGGEIAVNVASEPEPADLGVASGGAPGASGGDGNGEDLFSPATLDAA